MKKLLIISFFFIFTLWSWASLHRHWAFESSSYDLGIAINSLWNFNHGFGHICSLKNGIHMFLDHQRPAFLLIAPLFKLFPYAETLLILQAFFLSITGILLYFFAQQFSGKNHWSVYFIPFLFWMYLPIRYANLFDFHPEILMLPFFFLSIIGIQSTSKKLKTLGFFLLFFALGTKESAGPIACGLGIAWILKAGPATSKGFTQKAGIFCLALGCLVFYFNIIVVPALFDGQKYAYYNEYSHLGSDLKSILLSPILTPQIFFKALFTIPHIKFLIWTLAPLGFIPLLNWRALFVVLPAYLMLFMQQGSNRLQIGYHYGIEPSIGLFFALPQAILIAEKFLQPKKIITLFVISSALFLYKQPELSQIANNQISDHKKWLKNNLLPCIDNTLPISASSSIVPHLATRHWVKHIPDRHSENIETNPGSIDIGCIIFDSTLKNWPLETQDQINQFKTSLNQSGYKLYYSNKSLEVFQKYNSTCMVCVPQ